jgi:hypothetical protein
MGEINADGGKYRGEGECGGQEQRKKYPPIAWLSLMYKRGKSKIFS